ncbi:terpene synthase family protein [Streptomyces sp. XD-27]|uniref:terpene synthase family protein n=1 Tax=Streptomyces sp. XD-27 TaxID=3062779 RepID=UPI0026F43673|nr:terpene synthase family protein [Streptomyces sp. XD-27]WKX69088.1 terpene synthase family protein [Streptomyces sp. XD-27]
MGQRLDLPLPDVPASAGTAHAARKNAAWIARHQLLAGEEELRRHLSFDLPRLIVSSYPHVAGPDLDLLVDILSWFTVVDDLFDGPAGRSVAAARALVTPLTAVLRAAGTSRPPTGDARTGPEPAWRDLWHRQAHDMTGAWRDRAAGEWDDCLVTFVQEAAHREAGTVPTVEEGIRLRRHSSCLYPFMNMLERVTGEELPPALFEDPLFRRLRANTADAATYINDLFSLEREERRAQPFNMVRILQARCGLRRDEAIAAVRGQVHRLLRDSAESRTRLTAAHPAARSYLDGTADLITGVYAWTSNTRRYRHPAADR